jgi:hypothetical protein
MPFTEDNQPDPIKKKRGKSLKSLLMDAIKEDSLLDIPDEAKKEDIERAFIKHIAIRATNNDDKDSATLLKELLSKSYPALKATLPTVDFDLPEKASALEKAEAILKAVSDGHISPDIGVMLIQASKYTIDIEMATEIKARLDAIEDSMGLNV